MTKSTQDETDKVTVYYDGSCPLCLAEIAHYKRADKDQALSFVDVAADGFTGDERLARDDAMRRFHVRQADGQQHSGARAFVEVWQVIPGWRWLAKLAHLPGMTTLLEGVYRLLLRIRPLMVWLFCRLRRLLVND